MTILGKDPNASWPIPGPASMTGAFARGRRPGPIGMETSAVTNSERPPKDAYFQVVVIEPTDGLMMGIDPKVLFNETFETALRDRVLSELNRIAKTSENAKVRRGFSLRFTDGGDAIARKPSGSSPGGLRPNVFRAYLWPSHSSGLDDFRQSIAPSHNWGDAPDAVQKQADAEGGYGGRTPDGANFAFVSLGRIEANLSGPPRPTIIPRAQSMRAGQWVGSMVLHELGHAMGVPSNHHRPGVMNATTKEPNLDEDQPGLNFDNGNVRMIVRTLERIAGEGNRK